MRWYKYLNSCDQSLLSREMITRDMIPICNEGVRGREYSSFRFSEIYNYAISLDDKNRNLFEIIMCNRHQKPYFDVDIDLEDTSTIHTKEQKLAIAERLPETIIDSTLEKFPQINKKDVLVFNSHSNKKRSFHIIVDNWCVNNNVSNRKFFDTVMENVPGPWLVYIDNSMYKSIQQFRLFMSSKYLANRHKQFDSEKSTWEPSEDCINPLRELFLASLITFTENSTIIPFDEDENEREYEKIDLSSEMIKKVKKVISSMPYAKNFSVGNTDSSIISLRRLVPSYCEQCKRTHEHENPYIFVKLNGDIFFNCRRSKESIKIGNMNNEIITVPKHKIKLENYECNFYEIKKHVEKENTLNNSIGKEELTDSEESTLSVPKLKPSCSFSSLVSSITNDYVTSPTCSISSVESFNSHTTTKTDSEESWRVKRRKEKSIVSRLALIED